MVEISAKQVHALRTKTDLSMMDCKKALVESGGDEEKALQLLRKRFADKMSERADKEAANGRIGAFANDQGAALIEIRCETDFVATNDVFKAFADSVAELVVKSGQTDVTGLKSAKMSDGRPLDQHLVDLFGKLKENIAVHRVSLLKGPGACYVHHNGKVGTAIVCNATPKEAGRDICMHVASNTTLLGLNREAVAAQQVEEARERATAEVAGKPEQIREKIVAGKMDRWYGERVLVEQPFVKDDKKTVGAFAKENGFVINAYLKYEVGVSA